MIETEHECPMRNALIDTSEVEKYEYVECYECKADLEFTGTELIESE